VSHLLQLIDGLADATNLVICRGQADAAWRLEPSIDRNIVPGTTYAQRLQEERGIVDDYREGVKNLLPDLETDYLYSENPDDAAPGLDGVPARGRVFCGDRTLGQGGHGVVV